MRNGYAVVWFGSTADPQGSCDQTPVEFRSWGAIKSLYADR